jgi:biotin synthase
VIIEFPNHCNQNYLYCGLRRDDSHITRYHIEPHNKQTYNRIARNYDYKTVVLQSGEDSYYTAEKTIKIISDIKDFDLVLILDIGEKALGEYKACRDAGPLIGIY